MGDWPNYPELLNTCARYVQNEQWDSNYEIALSWAQQHYDDAQRLAGAIRNFEETWNRAFYGSRGIFPMTRLVESLTKIKPYLEILKGRQIENFCQQDGEIITVLWRELFDSLRPMRKPDRPFVATTKALHLLLPELVVPLDNAITEKYQVNGEQPQNFIKFQELMSKFALFILDSYIAEHGGDYTNARESICGKLYIQRTGCLYTKSLAKILDEYNWIKAHNK